MEYTFKVILLGDSLVGKSSLLSRLKNEIFVSSYCSTIGVDFGTINYERGDDHFKMQIWDTGGQEKFAPLIKAYYRNSTFAVIMFDLTNRASFNRVKKWVDEFNYYAKHSRPIIVLGNKSDLFNMRVLTKKEILEEIEGRLDLKYFEVSVKDDANLTEFIDYVITEFKRLVDNEILIPSPLNGIKVETPRKSFFLHKDYQGNYDYENDGKKKKRCCEIM